VFARRDEDGYQTVAPGIRMRTLCFGSNTLMSEFRLLRGHVLPRHAHPQEQTGYLVSGHIALTIGDETHHVVPGDSWCISGGVEHGAEVLQDAVAVEVFSPLREDYLPYGASTA
jgi:quercetin dioxygenase-like cupin family protein